MTHATGEHGGGSREGVRAGERYQSRLWLSFVLILVFFGVEVAAGLLTNSLALLSDAGHMLTDVAGLGMALAAIGLASRGSRHPSRTFGLYRLEILAALANTLLLFGIAGWVLYEAIERLSAPPHVVALPMLIVATLGLIVNVAAFVLLRQGAKESLNVKGAYLEVLGDMLGSLGVILAALVIQAGGPAWIDPVIAAGIGLFILPRAWRLGRQAVGVLMQEAPAHFDVEAMRSALGSIDGVAQVHDLHIWTVTSDMPVLTAHLEIPEGTDPRPVLEAATELLRNRYAITHATLQVESKDSTSCASGSW